jgi:hypothetical protein
MPDQLNITDPEYTIPGQLDRRVEAWPERTERRINQLEQRIRHLETVVHSLLNQATEDKSDL